jgi:hypothetical protein
MPFFLQRRQVLSGRYADIGAQDAESVRRLDQDQRVLDNGPADVYGGHVLFSPSHESMSGLHGLLAEDGRLLR